ncbi:hypothetical protein RTCIAT899_PA00240 (plasmid) [Rhizobium tropici CIAT 899]|nr:hypothetical protein RTCIAT899_PA00240 [Rhizobium tropici CIAT 899]
MKNVGSETLRLAAAMPTLAAESEDSASLLFNTRRSFFAAHDGYRGRLHEVRKV